MLGINFKHWVTDKFTEADRAHRERHRKKVVPADQNEPEDEQNEPENVQNEPERDNIEEDNSQSLPDVDEPSRNESTAKNVTEERVEGDDSNSNISGLLGANDIDLENLSTINQTKCAFMCVSTLCRVIT